MFLYSGHFGCSLIATTALRAGDSLSHFREFPATVPEVQSYKQPG